MITVTHNKNTLVYSPEEHRYMLNNTVPMLSVTTLVKQSFPQFDSNKIAAAYARKHGLTKEAVLSMWAEKGNNSAQFGTLVHAQAESLIKGETPDTATNDREAVLFRRVGKAVEELQSHLNLVATEKIVFSPEHKLAGTIDLIMESRDKGTVYILDWKTNEKISRDNPYNKFALPPIDHLPDNHVSHYGLQLSLYRYILQNEGYFPDTTDYKLALLHIRQDSFEWIGLPYLRVETQEILKAR